MIPKKIKSNDNNDLKYYSGFMELINKDQEDLPIDESQNESKSNLEYFTE